MSTLAVIAVGKSLWQSFPSMILQSNPSLFLSHNGKLGRGSQSSSPSRREVRLLSQKKICAPPPINIQRHLFELSNVFFLNLNLFCRTFTKKSDKSYYLSLKPFDFISFVRIGSFCQKWKLKIRCPKESLFFFYFNLFYGPCNSWNGWMDGWRNGWMDEMGVYEALLQNLLELTYA